ncbi:MAG: phosphoribosylformylglycinamidine cyclo-ligase [Gemmatimonadota bacterium]|nr:phosphoribosylformylglycinamidine cyclo-ligase [Gemmatimonadota bacterium]
MPEAPGEPRPAGRGPADGGDAPAYAEAGVDLAVADRLKRRLGALVEETLGPEVLGGPGGFGGCFDIGSLPEAEPVLVATTDGVGTKVLVAQAADRHDTIGEDLVNHCVNDLLASGARPLLFLDYIAAGELREQTTLALVEGFARGCRANRIPLLGGETAEMPGVYPPDGYDLAGFAVGIAPRGRLERWGRAEPGDAILALPSSGLHTNGYTLARKIVLEREGKRLEETVPWGEASWADVLLAVHRSYRDAVEPLLDDPDLRAAAHVTGGGFSGNLPRALPEGLGARIDPSAWEVPPVFRWLAEAGGIGDGEMVRVFNMGIGFCLVVAPSAVDRITAGMAETGERVARIGSVIEGEGVAWKVSG